LALQNLQSNVTSPSGFTLIELLVVILIIGILAAIAIPAFLNQKSKASDASAKVLANTAQIAAETFAIDHNGTYLGISAAALHVYEATIPTAAGSGNAWLSNATGTATGYTVTAQATTNDTYSITRTVTGALTRSCANFGSSKACVNGTW
jgi:type IV pilus assembly protein PilA